MQRLHQHLHLTSTSRPFRKLGAKETGAGRRALDSACSTLEFDYMFTNYNFKQTLTFKTKPLNFNSLARYVFQKSRLSSEDIVGEVIVKSPYECSSMLFVLALGKALRAGCCQIAPARLQMSSLPSRRPKSRSFASSAQVAPAWVSRALSGFGSCVFLSPNIGAQDEHGDLPPLRPR